MLILGNLLGHFIIRALAHFHFGAIIVLLYQFISNIHFNSYLLKYLGCNEH